MKKIFYLTILIILMTTAIAFGFLYEITILTPEAIKELTAVQLQEVFLEAKIEEKTSSEFHVAAGFSNAKEYEKRKNLLRYIVSLRREMLLRSIEPEPIDQWLK